jgi:hypothetical protein
LSINSNETKRIRVHLVKPPRDIRFIATPFIINTKSNVRDVKCDVMLSTSGKILPITTYSRTYEVDKLDKGALYKISVLIRKSSDAVAEGRSVIEENQSFMIDEPYHTRRSSIVDNMFLYESSLVNNAYYKINKLTSSCGVNSLLSRYTPDQNSLSVEELRKCPIYIFLKHIAKHYLEYQHILQDLSPVLFDSNLLNDIADTSNEVGPTTLTQDDIDEAVNIIILLTIYHVQNTTESTNKQQYYKYCIGLLSNLIDTVSP